MLPAREEAEKLLSEAESLNPGPWANHSRITAYCAEKIAKPCQDLDSEKAYILGLLHDIGRRFGVTHLRHVYDGYFYMLSLGFDDAAKICLTHSFNNKILDDYVGNFDLNTDEVQIITRLLENTEFNDYDRLIQLCDALAGTESVLDIEDRMADVERRYGFYPERKRKTNLNLKAYFEAETGHNLYEILDKDTFHI